eukprot:1948956-Rhodomonas_salina.7
MHVQSPQNQRESMPRAPTSHAKACANQSTHPTSSQPAATYRRPQPPRIGGWGGGNYAWERLVVGTPLQYDPRRVCALSPDTGRWYPRKETVHQASKKTQILLRTMSDHIGYSLLLLCEHRASRGQRAEVTGHSWAHRANETGQCPPGSEYDGQYRTLRTTACA